MTLEQLRALDGLTVLVEPSVSDSQNSVGKRASVRVVPSPGAPGGPETAAPARVEIVLQIPDMFTQLAQERVIELTEKEAQQLLACARDGSGTWVNDRVLESAGAASATRRAQEGRL